MGEARGEIEGPGSGLVATPDELAYMARYSVMTGADGSRRELEWRERAAVAYRVEAQGYAGMARVVSSGLDWEGALSEARRLAAMGLDRVAIVRDGEGEGEGPAPVAYPAPDGPVAMMGLCLEGRAAPAPQGGEAMPGRWAEPSPRIRVASGPYVAGADILAPPEGGCVAAYVGADGKLYPVPLPDDPAPGTWRDRPPML